MPPRNPKGQQLKSTERQTRNQQVAVKQKEKDDIYRHYHNNYIAFLSLSHTSPFKSFKKYIKHNYQATPYAPYNTGSRCHRTPYLSCVVLFVHRIQGPVPKVVPAGTGFGLQMS